ncbi:unnamed protein product [Effrenium voratum]|nr:unnamed protein product [Effrenium voratum]
MGAGAWLAACLAIWVGVQAKELTKANWEEETAGKTLFLRFGTPWCGHCKDMKPAWDKLTEEFADHDFVLVAEVDCDGSGKTKCKELGVKGYPEVRHGNPDHLEDYAGSRDLPTLQKFAQDLRPTCGPQRLEACDAFTQRQIQDYMEMRPEDLDAKVKAQEELTATADREVNELLHSMQQEYQEAKRRKEQKVQDIRAAGLTLMRSVKEYRLRQKDEL